MIQTQHARKSIRTSFDPSMISVTAITEWDINAYIVLHTDQNDVWVYDGDTTLTLYDEQLVEKKTLKAFSNLYDMVLTASQDIIATDRNNCLVKIPPSGDVSTLCSTASPTGICINNRGHIVVGLHTDQGDALETSPYKLAIYSSDGSAVLQEIENDEDGKPLFRGVINQVKQNGNGDYVVAEDGRVVCVSSEGRFKWDYTVGKGIHGMVCDKCDNVIIAEYINHKIRLLSSEGKLVTTLLSAEDGISYPLSLSIDRHGQLWIGQYRTLKVVKYIE